VAVMVDLIYCAAGNSRYAQIAIDAGFGYGAQLPATVYHPVIFADQNWKKPDKDKYMAALKKHRPIMASVLDLEREEQLPEVIGWAEDAAQFVNVVMIIPKAHGVISRLPRRVAGATVRLGYSVPTRHGGTEVFAAEFIGWPVHLLGGSPGAQLKIAHYLNVVSADGNMAQLMATRHCAFWQPGKKPFTNKWPSIKDADGRAWPHGDANYEAFRRSCKNIMVAWKAHARTAGAAQG
jgi:hypothetical protein